MDRLKELEEQVSTLTQVVVEMRARLSTLEGATVEKSVASTSRSRRELLKLGGIAALGAVGVSALRAIPASAASHVSSQVVDGPICAQSLTLLPGPDYVPMPGLPAGGLGFGTGVSGSGRVLYRIQPSLPARGPMGVSYGEPTFNRGVVDPVLMFGYNADITGPALAGENSWAFSFEGHYDDGSGQIKMENYTQYISADGTVTKRPIFWQFNRTTNALTASEYMAAIGDGLNGGGFNVNYDDGTPTGSRIMQLNKGGVQFVPSGAAGAHFWKVYLNNTLIATMSDSPIGGPGAALSVGVIDNSAAGTFDVGASNVGVMGLVARGRAGQNVSIFEVQDETKTAHIRATKGSSSPAVTSSFVVGKAVLANNATDGFLYIPTVAGTPSGVPTTQTGTAAIVYDTSAHKIWIYDAGWKGVVVA